MSETNKLDNSEYSAANTSKDLTMGSSGTQSEEALLFQYMQNLKLRAEIESDNTLVLPVVTDKTWDDSTGKWVTTTKKVPVKDLLPKDSEYERVRKLIIVKLNEAGPESELFRRYASRFGTNSIFAISSKAANFVLDEKRRRSTFEELVNGPLKV